jgi:hypothetical protein
MDLVMTLPDTPSTLPLSKSTNWKVITPVSLIIVFFCICLVILGVLVYFGTRGTDPLSMLASDTPTVAPTPIVEYSLEGDWTIHGDIDCDGSYVFSVLYTFFSDYTYVYLLDTGGELTGTWSTSGEDVDFLFHENLRTHYIGTLSSTGDYMEGTYDSTIGGGCWYGER